MYINLWGSGGGGSGGHGAFVSGALQVVHGETLRVIVGTNTDSSEESGCGGASSGGGRSSVQRLIGSAYVDVATAGGGGSGMKWSAPGGDAGAGPFAGNGSSSDDDPGQVAAGGILNATGLCAQGSRGCGLAGVYSGGGGGYCGGLGSDDFGGGGGGGCSFSGGFNVSELSCVYLADNLIGNLAFTPLPGDGAAQPGASGLVIISELPEAWAPCSPVYPPQSLSPSPSPSPTPSCSPTPSPTPSPSSATAPPPPPAAPQSGAAVDAAAKATILGLSLALSATAMLALYFWRRAARLAAPPPQSDDPQLLGAQLAERARASAPAYVPPRFVVN